MAFSRITLDRRVMAGLPTIRGMRIPVATVVLMVADGKSFADNCRELPDLEGARARPPVGGRDLPLS